MIVMRYVFLLLASRAMPSSRWPCRYLTLVLVASDVAFAPRGRGRRMREPPAPLPAPPADAFTAAVDVGAAMPVEENLSCHARDGFDISGDAAFVWGLSFHVKSASECCRACSQHQRLCGKGEESKGKVFTDDGRRCTARRSRTCNAWVFCGGPRCFSYDVHNHTFGECWLKHESNEPNPIAVGPTLPAAMRAAPR